MKIAGMKSALEPQCPFTGEIINDCPAQDEAALMIDCIIHTMHDGVFPGFRWRWSLLLFTGLLLISLSSLGVYLLRGALKGQCFILFSGDSSSVKSNIVS